MSYLMTSAVVLLSIAILSITLDKAFLNTISQPADQYIIYADNCLLSDEFMRLNNIVFKKIPRDIRKF